MPGVRVPVSAAADRSLSVVFEPLIVASGRARAKVKSDAERAAAEEAKAANKAAAAAAKAFAQIEAASAKAAAREIADAQKAAQARVAADQKAFDQRLRMVKRAAEAEEREIVRTARAAENRERRQFEAQQKDAGATGQRRAAVATDAYQTFGGVAGAAGRTALGFARGAGVDFDLQSSVRRSVNLEKQAGDLSASAYIKGAAGPQGIRVDSSEIERTARAVANLAAYDPGKVLEGLQKFVGKTGDLATGNAALADMAKLARATGSELEDVVDAAGDVSANLGDAIPAGAERAKVVGRIMQMIAGQGKIGAVEMKDLAVQMAKLAASSTAFEGSREGLMGQLGAFAQMSRAMGGSASATQAATSVAALVNTFKTPARMAAFEKITEKKVYNESTGMLRNPKELLLEALQATQGDPAKFKSIFANVQGARAVEGFATVFREGRAAEMSKAGPKGESSKDLLKRISDAGIAAVNAKFAEFERASVDSKQVEEDFGLAMKKTSAKAQLFQNKLDAVVTSMADRVLPALERLAPDALKVVDSFAKLISWASENPWTSVMLAITASIGKAAIGNAVKEKILEMMRGGGAGTPGAAVVQGGAAATGAGVARAVGGMVVVGGVVALADVVSDVGKENAEIGEREWGGGSFGGKTGGFNRTAALARKRREGMTATGAGLSNFADYLTPYLNPEAQNGGESMAAGPRGPQSAAPTTGGGAPVEVLNRIAAILQANLEAVQANKPPKTVTIDNLPGPTVDPRGRDNVNGGR